MKINSLVSALIGGVVGAGLTILGQGARLNLKPIGMTYNDWAGILLAAAALLITVLGVVVAVAAIWGFTTIKSGAEGAAVKHVTEQLSAGPLGTKLDAAFGKFLDQSFRDGRFRQLLEERVNEVIFGGPAVRESFEDKDTEFEPEDAEAHAADTARNDVGEQ